MAMGEVSIPDSAIQWMPVISPLPLSVWVAANAWSFQIAPSRGIMTVTPVRATRGAS